MANTRRRRDTSCAPWRDGGRSDALQAVTREIPLEEMFRGIIPFLLVMILCVAILIIFPDVALFLPNLLRK